MCQYIFAGFLALFYTVQIIDSRPQFQPAQMPTVCGSKPYCTEKDPNYPENVIESLLMGFDNLWLEVVNETIPGKRQGFHENECKYTPVTDPIHAMVDENDKLRYVVQNKKWFNQIIYMEECLNPGRITNKETDVLSAKEVENNVFECKQKYLDYNFVVLSLDGTKLETAKMKNGVPVCCACVLTQLNYE